jgi:hypothetical protein
MQIRTNFNALVLQRRREITVKHVKSLTNFLTNEKMFSEIQPFGLENVCPKIPGFAGNRNASLTSCYKAISSATTNVTVALAQCAAMRTNVTTQNFRLAWITNKNVQAFVKSLLVSENEETTTDETNIRFQSYASTYFIGAYDGLGELLSLTDYKWVNTFDTADYTSLQSRAMYYGPGASVTIINSLTEHCLVMNSTGSWMDASYVVVF